jgi:hypothetical protein
LALPPSCRAQPGAKPDAILHISRRIQREIGAVCLRQHADQLGRRAAPQLARGNPLARGQHRAGRQHPAGFDHRAVQHHRGHADESPILQPCRVNNRHMPHRHIVADQAFHALAGIHMQDRAVLNIAARADANHIRIAAQNAIEPDAGTRPDRHIADHRRIRRDPGIRRDMRDHAVQRPERAGRVGWVFGHAGASLRL